MTMLQPELQSFRHELRAAVEADLARHRDRRRHVKRAVAFGAPGGLAALGLALCYPDPDVARGFAWFWLVSFVIGSVWDAATSRADGRDHAFLVAVLCLGLLDTTPEMAEAFSIFGLACVIASGLRYAWIGMQLGGLTNCSIPAALALTAVVGRL